VYDLIAGKAADPLPGPESEVPASRNSGRGMFDPFAYHLNPAAIPTALTAAGVLVLGLLVLIRERRSSVSLLFALVTLLVFVWLAGMVAMYSARTPETALGWARVIYVAIPLIPASFYHFTVALLGISASVRGRLTAIWIAGGFFSLLIPSSDLFILGVYDYWWGWYTYLSPAALLLIGYFAIPLGLAVVQFIREYRKPRPENERRRLLALMLAFGVGYLAVVDFFGSFGVPLYPLGFVAVSGFLILAARAIWKYRLVDLTPQFAANRILETMQGSVVVIDLDGTICLVNHAACEMLGWQEEALVGTPMSQLIETPMNIGRASDTLMNGGVIRDRAMIWKQKSGETIEVSVSASMLRDEEGIPVGIVYVGSDVTDRRRAEQIEYQAFHDSLTGLPNRLYFRRQLDKALDQPEPGFSAVVLFLDLDGFKLINDSLGHTIGDQLLQGVARRFKKSLRDRDFIARLGGDEFTVLASVSDPADGQRIAQKLLQTVRRPFDIAGHELFITVSIGIAVAPHHGEDAETLIKNADAAMYLAKELGKDTYQLCGPALERRARERLSLQNRLRRAVDHGELLLHYQPIVSVDTGRIIGAEALLRWETEDEILLPSAFLAVAEESRLIEPIGEWVLHNACRDLTRLEADPSIYLAVNLSVHQLQQRHGYRQLQSALDACGADPSRLIFEITETVVMQNVDRIIRTLRDLKGLGAGIAIDDFGTGYSAMSYLARLPADVLKIDRSFISRIGSGEGSEAIIRAIQALAAAMELSVVAEGVENDDQLAFIRSVGCAAVQGFLFSPPVPLEQFVGIVEAERSDAGLKYIPQVTRTDS
jgi:diguanylate cyclase (GGDEF)-like protein/PAS domain S-box-containing protein